MRTCKSKIEQLFMVAQKTFGAKYKYKQALIEHSKVCKLGEYCEGKMILGVITECQL